MSKPTHEDALVKDPAPNQYNIATDLLTGSLDALHLDERTRFVNGTAYVLDGMMPAEATNAYTCSDKKHFHLGIGLGLPLASATTAMICGYVFALTLDRKQWSGPPTLEEAAVQFGIVSEVLRVRASVEFAEWMMPRVEFAMKAWFTALANEGQVVAITEEEGEGTEEVDLSKLH